MFLKKKPFIPFMETWVSATSATPPQEEIPPVTAQPLVLNYVKGTLALAHNGNLVNTEELRREFEENGAIFHTTTDSEVIAYCVARERVHSTSVEEAIKKTAAKIRGAYGLVIASPRKLVGVRDPLGLKPLCIGKREDAYVIASESCALSARRCKIYPGRPSR